MTIAGTVATTAVSGALNTSQTYIRPSLQNPNTPGVPELIFADIHHYMAACFESDEACSLFNGGKANQAGRLFRKAFTNIEFVIRREDPDTLQRIVRILAIILRYGYNNIINIMCRYFVEFATQIHIQTHPLPHIFRHLLKHMTLDALDYKSLIIFISKSISNLTESTLGRYYYEAYWIQDDMMKVMRDLGDEKSVDCLACDLSRECDRELGPQTSQALYTLESWAWQLLLLGHFSDAEVVGQELIKRSSIGSPLLTIGYGIVAIAQAEQRDFIRAEHNLRQAQDLEDLLKKEVGSYGAGSFTRQCQLWLVYCLDEQSRFEEADALYAERESYYESDELRKFDEV
ncbi:MAG: hypothetical protein MMC33_003443 [Icmadophila ericetorum]|nr:hypothetical protein [Icmadophila ericetorum]